MKAAIITIGDEILIGQITDTNSSFIAKSLDSIGIEVVEMRSISDNKSHILQTFQSLQNIFEVVIITGGLGPTKDDITKHTICEYFDDKLVIDESVLHHVVTLIEKVMKRPASQINKDQALVPSKATVLFNQYGTAPGMWIQKEQTVFISLPGVPYEMKYLMQDQVLPKIVSAFDRPFIIHKTIMTYGQGESLVAERIESWEDALPSNVSLAYLPSPGRVRLRLTARGKNEQELESTLSQLIADLNLIIGDIIVGFDENESIQEMLSRLLVQKNKTISLAESCTGGLIASMITEIPGASQIFNGSAVTYATESKTNILNVPKSAIDAHGVVSEKIAALMAENAKKLFKTDFAIATTGNAGPNKGDSDAEVGTVCIAIATPQNTLTETFNFGTPREKVILRAATKALELLYKEILKNY
uniref:competence/damage-inducible protein A n=2 Tax=Flavobacterium sp. TaxID=239 RepID=UPI004049AC2A